ncbi:MAG: YaiI/YqxD family protein [Candidatus Riflebacteria bacterium]|nr:YaiI/YqxD family protein [Candidatus Riflebacteria bacterium]
MTIENRSQTSHIFVDADACPVKNEIYRVAKRYGLHVTLVAGSSMRFPENQNVILQIVGQGLDMADDWIVEHVEVDDIVITGDIPLAARCVRKEAYVLGHAGKPFTAENIGPVLATRDLLSRLRESGEITGGPAPFTQRDRSKFLQELDKVIGIIHRKKAQRNPPK